MNVTLPNGKVINGVPEGTTKEQIKAKAIASGIATAEDFGEKSSSSVNENIVPGSYPEIPQVDSSGVPISAPQQRPTQLSPSIIDRLRAGGEALLSAGTGATTGQIGGMAGALQGIGSSVINGTYGTQQGADDAEQKSADVASSMTYSPRSALGQEYTQNVSDALSPLAGIAPATQELGIIGQSVRGVAPQLENSINNITGVNRKSDVANRILAGSNDRDLAQYKISNEKTNPTVSADDLAKEVSKQGFDDGFIQAAKQTTPENRRKILQMVNIAERGKSDSVYGSSNRPLDIPGKSLSDRVTFLRDTNKQAAKEVDAAAEDIKGKPVDYNPAINQFAQDINDAGVSMNENGSLNFKGSDLEFSAGDKKLIQDVYNRAKTIDGSDAYRVHKLKRLIDTTVDYGKGSQTGVTPQGERIVKSFRRAVDQSLDDAFPNYNDANTKYADTIQALESFQDAAGAKVNLFGDNSDKALGTVSRRLLSNTQSRVNLMDSIKNIEDVSKKYGSHFNDDIVTQVMAADELDKVFGSSARTSLAGDVEKSTRTALKAASGDKTVTGLAVDAAAKLAERARGINQKNAFKSLKDLLSRDNE